MRHLDEIEARASAATPGPWTAVPAESSHYLDAGDGPEDCNGCVSGRPLLRAENHEAEDGDEEFSMHYHLEESHDVASATGSITGNYDYEIGGILSGTDVDFVAGARTDVPLMAAALRAALDVRAAPGNGPTFSHGFNAALNEVCAAIESVLAAAPAGQ